MTTNNVSKYTPPAYGFGLGQTLLSPYVVCRNEDLLPSDQEKSMFDIAKMVCNFIPLIPRPFNVIASRGALAISGAFKLYGYYFYQLEKRLRTVGSKDPAVVEAYLQTYYPHDNFALKHLLQAFLELAAAGFDSPTTRGALAICSIIDHWYQVSVEGDKDKILDVISCSLYLWALSGSKTRLMALLAYQAAVSSLRIGRHLRTVHDGPDHLKKYHKIQMIGEIVMTVGRLFQLRAIK